MKQTQLFSIAACSQIVAAYASANGSFNILSMNVAGLPAIFNGNDVPGDKATNAKTIGSRFAQYGYDIINVQEDFNYHAYVYETDNHPYRTPTSGGAGIGSGLNTLSNFNWVDFSRTKWDDCSNASGADCLTPKGFTFLRAKIADGAYVDVYNLHADAGTEAGDETARTKNLNQVAAYIDVWSKGNAVLVFGDTNSRYTRTADNVKSFGEQANLADVWIEQIRKGVVPTKETLCDNPSLTNQCETVDKIFYRGNPILGLKATSFQYESLKFLQTNGSVLSDHNPVSATFEWQLSTSLRQSDFVGGPHGTWYSDVPALATITSPKPTRITFRGGARLDSVSLALSTGQTFTHGGTGGSVSSMALASDERWVSATLCQGKYSGHTRLFYIEAVTTKSNKVSAGTKTSDCQEFAAPQGWQIVGFLGQSGDEIDQLAFVYSSM